MQVTSFLGAKSAEPYFFPQSPDVINNAIAGLAK